MTSARALAVLDEVHCLIQLEIHPAAMLEFAESAQTDTAAKQNNVGGNRWIGRADSVEPGHEDLRLSTESDSGLV
jgi:hypothetical protein